MQFGTVSIGDKTARLGVNTFKAGWCVVAKPMGWHADQSPLPGMDGGDITVPGVFDVKGIRITGNEYAIGLTFALKDVNIESLANFAKRQGKLIVDDVEELPEPEPDDEGDEDEE